VKSDNESDETSRQQVDKRELFIPQFSEKTRVPNGLDYVVGSNDKKQIEEQIERDLQFFRFDFYESGEYPMDRIFCHIPTLNAQSHGLA
jgi:hypothetical protein